MRNLALRKRFINNSAIVVAGVMLISVLVVDVSYLKELERSAQEKLQLHIYNLLSVARQEKNSLNLPAILHNSRFNTEGSGLLAVVFNHSGQPIWHSLSVTQPTMDLPLATKIGQWRYGESQFAGESYHVASYQIAWEEAGQRNAVHFVVAENQAFTQHEIKRFRLWLVVGFCIITASLLACQYLVLKQAFQPISQLENEIAALEEGRIKSLSPSYPKELRGVAKNLNALIDKEYRQRERYRASMADLAHSLKTPMTIIAGEIAQHPGNATLKNAIARIDSSIEYQLRRAVISGHTLLSQGTKVDQVLQLVVEAMDKIYVDRKVTLDTNISGRQTFYGDENDLMEILGNLLDNAYKHANRKIKVTVEDVANAMTMVIEDDGPGFSEQDRQRIFTRGERLDRQGLGQGIGLAVVYDIVTSYHGHIQASRSDLGGARFELIFQDQGAIS